MAGFFDTLFGGGAEREAADKNRALIAQYGPESQGYLTGAYNTGRGDINQAIGAFDPLKNLGAKYNQAGELYNDALGVNGPGGNANATSSFQAGPGYQFQFDQGMDALNRRRSVGGMLNSGNADIDAIRFGQGTANQEFQNWLANLQKSGQMGLQATTAAAQGQGQGFTNLANLAQQYGLNQTGVAGNVLSGGMDANKLQAAGEAAGAKNLANLGMQALTAVASGGASLGTSLGSLGSLGGASTGATFGGYGVGGNSLGSGMMGGVKYPAF
jgi:hypothetical protein